MFTSHRPSSRLLSLARGQRGNSSASQKVSLIPKKPNKMLAVLLALLKLYQKLNIYNKGLYHLFGSLLRTNKNNKL